MTMPAFAQEIGSRLPNADERAVANQLDTRNNLYLFVANHDSVAV